MNVREKLIEILRKPIFPHELVDPTEAVADYLLDSGVTVQEWISVNDRLPNPHEDVLVYDKTAYSVTCACLSFLGEWFDVPMKNEVTHWMPLPEPPKGE